MPFCTSCGTSNTSESKFCFQCGNKLVTSSEPASSGMQSPTSTGSTPALGDATATIAMSGGPGGADKTETSDRDLSPVEAAAVDALPAGHALLVVQRGPGAGNRFLVDDDETLAGRHPKCEIHLDDVTVSRKHATFTRTGSNFSVKDAGSLNGTYVNRKRIDDTQLADGDEVQIGKFRFVFFAGREAQ